MANIAFSCLQHEMGKKLFSAWDRENIVFSMGWGCRLLQLQPNSVIYLHSSVSLSLEYLLSHLTNVIELIIYHQHSSAWPTSLSSSSISPRSLISLTSSAICTSLSLTTASWHSLYLLLTKSLPLPLLFSQLAPIATNRYWRNTSSLGICLHCHCLL